MKILIPSAKQMIALTPCEKVRFSTETLKLSRLLAKKTSKELAKFYKITEANASVEKERFQNIVENQYSCYKALDLYNGLMYRFLKQDVLDEVMLAYLSEHVLITSALYGVIPIMHPIAPYRLDFMHALTVEGKMLKAFWKENYDKAIANEECVISLLSSEFEMVFSKKQRDKFIKINFMENDNGKLKKHSTISKKARGSFLRALAINQVKTLDDLKKITFAGYYYVKEHSNQQQITFICDLNNDR